MAKNLTDNLRARLSEKLELNDLYEAARVDGMVTLRQVAIQKMLEGVTTYEEVIAVTG